MSKTNRNILITGASRGIGKAIALKLCEAGDQVIINYLRNTEAAELTAEAVKQRGATPICVQANVRSEGDLKRLANTFDSVDILVHNAAIGALKPYKKLRKNHWDLTLESSLRPFWMLTKMVTLNPGASVVGISSLGSQRYIPGYAAMGAAKAGMEALTRQLSVELAPDGVRVNTVCGGLIATETIQYFPDPEKMIELTKALTPLGDRIGSPEDVANAVWLLNQPEASWITGQVLIVDGGYSCGNAF